MDKLVQNKRLVVFVLTILTFLVYFNSLNGAFVVDDIATLTNNPLLSRPGEYLLKGGLPGFTLSINYLIGKDNPFIYHLTNVFFHLGAVVLTYFFLLQITSRKISFLASAIFAVHPIHVEVVSWISGRPYALSAAFLLASFLFYILSGKKTKKASKVPKHVNAEKEKRIYYFLASLICFCIAFFSNSKLIVFFPILVLYELSFSKITKNWKKLIPYFILTLLFLVRLFQPFQARTEAANFVYTGGFKFYNPFRQIPTALSLYMELFAWPQRLTFYHEDFSHFFWFRVGITLLLFVGLIYFYKKQRLLFFGFSLFVLSLIPTLLPIKIAFVVAERYVYFGSVGLCLVLAWVLVKGLKKHPQTLLIVSGLLLVLFSLRTIVRNRDWQNQKSLWLATTKVSATSSSPWNSLGDVYCREGNYQLGIRAFLRAIQLNPTYVNAYHNLGLAYLKMGDFDQAIVWFKRATAIYPFPQSFNDMGVAYLQKGDFEKAEEQFRKMIELDPNNPIGYNSLGVLFFKQNKPEEARQAWQKALELNPSAKGVRENLQLLK